VVWDDKPTHLLQRAKSIEAGLLKFVGFKSTTAAQDEKALMESSEYEVDEETGLMANKERPILLYNCFLVGCSLCLLTVLIGLGYVKIADEVYELHKWTSLVFLAMTPVNAFLTLVSSSLNLFCCRESYHKLILMKLFALVFLFRHHQRHRPNYWTNPASYQELQIFLHYPASTPPNEDSSTHHYPMPSIQGESGGRHPTDSAIHHPSKRPSLPTNSKEVLLISSSTTMVSNSYQMRAAKPTLNSMQTTILARLPALATTSTDSSEKANSRKLPKWNKAHVLPSPNLAVVSYRSPTTTSKMVLLSS
jgi:hypothetical protein